MARDRLVLTYNGQADFSVDITLGYRQFIRHVFHGGESLDVTDICSPDELKRHPGFAALIKQDLFSLAEENTKQIQTARLVQTTPGALAIVFADLGLKDMTNNSYNIHLGGETVNRTTPQASSIASTGFTLLNGTITDVHHITVVGNVKD